MDDEVDGIKRCLLLAVVVVITLEVDLLTALPFAVHHERTITNRSKQEVVCVINCCLRNRNERDVCSYIEEVVHRLVEFDNKGVVIGALKTFELIGLTLVEFFIAKNWRKVERNLRRSLHLGACDTLPTALEALGIDLVTVVEGCTLNEVEGVGKTVVRNIPGRSCLRNDLVGFPIKGSQRVKEVVLNLRTFRLLCVVWIDCDRLIDINFNGSAFCAGCTS